MQEQTALPGRSLSLWNPLGTPDQGQGGRVFRVVAVPGIQKGSWPIAPSAPSMAPRGYRAGEPFVFPKKGSWPLGSPVCLARPRSGGAGQARSHMTLGNRRVSAYSLADSPYHLRG